jgi:hypothetical protein
MSLNREKYRSFCKRELNIPLFSQDWWLDAVCGDDQWNVVLVEKGNEIVASMPFFLVNEANFKIIKMPKLTQNMGPFIKYPASQKYEKKLAFEKKVMTGLIEQFPQFDKFSQSFHHSVSNWLPFHWQGFKQTIRYTYILPDISDLEIIWKSFRENTRREIRKAEKHLIIKELDDIKPLYKMIEMTYRRQQKKVPFTQSFLERLDNAANKQKARIIFGAYDSAGSMHAAIYMVQDANTAYYLLGGADPDLRNSGASSLLIWYAIQHFSKISIKNFDFEGSMNEHIEQFVRGFGAIQTPYHYIRKFNSRLLYYWNLVNGRF